MAISEILLESFEERERSEDDRCVERAIIHGRLLGVVRSCTG